MRTPTVIVKMMVIITSRIDGEVDNGDKGVHDDAEDRKTCGTCAPPPAHLNDLWSNAN